MKSRTGATRAPAARMCAVVAAIGIWAMAGAGVAVATPSGPSGPTVPVGFRAQSTSWTSAADGWVLGTAPPDPSVSPVVRTVDGGRHWAGAGSVPAPLAPSGEPGVTELRFADRLHGWAFGPSLYASGDGGQSWRQATMPGGGRQVLALAAGGGQVYAAVSPCEIGTPTYECAEPTTVWRSSVTQPAWSPVPVQLGVAFQVTIAVAGQVAYVSSAPGPGQPDAFYATTDGHEWSSRPTPCHNSDGESLIDVAPVSGHTVALLCLGDPGWSQSVKRVVISGDTGWTSTPAGTAPLPGIHTQLAASPAGALILASASSGTWLYLNSAGEQWTTALEYGDGGADWNDPVFVTASTGYIVYAPAGWAEGAGTLLVTHDAGRHWAPVAFGAGRPLTR